MDSAVKVLSLNDQTAKEFSICNFLRQCTLFHSSCFFLHTHHLPTVYKCSNFYPFSPTFVLSFSFFFFFFFGSGHPNVYKVYIAFLK